MTFASLIVALMVTGIIGFAAGVWYANVVLPWFVDRRHGSVGITLPTVAGVLVTALAVVVR